MCFNDSQDVVVLHGRDDFGLTKSGFLWKRTRNIVRQWKRYYFVLTNLCLICYHQGPNGFQGKSPKLKINLSDVKSIQLQKRQYRRGMVHYIRLHHCGMLTLRCSDEVVAREWMDKLTETTRMCVARKQVHSELRRASFKRHVEQNVKDKHVTHSRRYQFEDLPRLTLLNRTPWDERIRAANTKAASVKTLNRASSFTNGTARCYSYNENIVLSTPNIANLDQVNYVHRGGLDRTASFHDIDTFHASAGDLNKQRKVLRSDSGKGSDDFSSVSPMSSEASQNNYYSNKKCPTYSFLKKSNRSLHRDSYEKRLSCNLKRFPSSVSSYDESHLKRFQNHQYKQHETESTGFMSGLRRFHQERFNNEIWNPHKRRWSSDLDLVPEDQAVDSNCRACYCPGRCQNAKVYWKQYNSNAWLSRLFRQGDPFFGSNFGRNNRFYHSLDAGHGHMKPNDECCSSHYICCPEDGIPPRHCHKITCKRNDSKCSKRSYRQGLNIDKELKHCKDYLMDTYLNNSIEHHHQKENTRSKSSKEHFKTNKGLGSGRPIPNHGYEECETTFSGPDESVEDIMKHMKVKEDTIIIGVNANKGANNIKTEIDHKSETEPVSNKNNKEFKKGKKIFSALYLPKENNTLTIDKVKDLNLESIKTKQKICSENSDLKSSSTIPIPINQVQNMKNSTVTDEKECENPCLAGISRLYKISANNETKKYN